ncbi:MAG: hypothetical protein ACLS5K_05215 [Streptococcus salivarius]
MPLVITNCWFEVNVHGDRIYRIGEIQLIRQEGKSTDKMTKGQTVVTISIVRPKMAQHLQTIMVNLEMVGIQLLKL